ncbi:hypothetical protein [Gemmiger sp.]|uniref:hypothetical protein n=1 Tax=Gemmiger sp. TaxID=2049027 RepID=UPI003FD7E781
MKKLASFVLALAMAAVCAAPAMADNQITQSTSQSCDTTVSFTIAPSYTVTIPAATVIPFNSTGADTNLKGTLRLDAAQLELNHKITVSAAVTPLHDSAKPAHTIPFTLRKDGAEFTSVVFTQAGEEVQLSVHIDENAWKTVPAGKYEGSVTFEIRYQ